MTPIFHITSRAEAARAERSGEHAPAGFAAEGFVHCSYAGQVTRVADARFRDRSDLVLLEIDRDALPCEVVDENLEGGTELFPHVYGRLPMSAVVAVHDLPCREDGRFDLPRGLRAGDAPAERSRDGAPRASLLVNIDVGDLGRAERFYTAAFGLRVGRRLGSFGIELLGGAAPIYLLARAPGSPASPATGALRTYDRHWTPVHLDFVVDEIEPAVERSLVAGARLEQPVATHAWGKLALLADPFGNGFCFVQFLGRGYDEMAGGESGS